MKINVIFEMLKQLFALFTSKQRIHCIVIFIMMFVGAILELLGITAILPYLEALMSETDLQGKWYVKLLTNFTGIDSRFEILVWLGVLIAFVYIIKNLYLLFAMYIQNKFCFGIQKDLSTKMLKHYLQRPYAFFLNVNSASILRGVNEDITGVYYCLLYFFKLAIELFVVIMITIYILMTDYMIALTVIFLVALCLISIVLGIRKKLNSLAIERRKVSALRNKYAYQAVMGIKEITVMQRKKEFIQKYDDVSVIKCRNEVLYHFFEGAPTPIIEAICASGVLGAVTLRVVKGVDVSSFVPQLGTFAIAAFKMMPAVSKISSCIAGLIFYRPSLNATYENYLAGERNAKSKGVEKEQRLINEYKEKDFAKIEIKNVSYKYADNAKNVIQELSLSIDKGSAIALIGKSGAGKTTLADIMLGLLEPQKGQVLCDGTNVFDMPFWWSRMIGYVPQAVFLIDDTIKNNILFGVEENQISEKKIWEALEQAQLKDFVQNLPEGLNTIVGERGIKLSGGQRQRIAIARALYYNPPILVMDEATSALDTETESALMEAIEELKGKKTLIIVAHRLTTVKNCDIIYEVKDGKAYMRDKKELF